MEVEMNNVQYLKKNKDQVRELIADAEARAQNGEPFLDAHLSTLRRHLQDIENQLVAAEQELVAVY
jgi:polyhydroxyalkanoate synthesis regulator phasin